jgi:hypothetical protein
MSTEIQMNDPSHGELTNLKMKITGQPVIIDSNAMLDEVRKLRRSWRCEATRSRKRFDRCNHKRDLHESWIYDACANQINEIISRYI